MMQMILGCWGIILALYFLITQLKSFAELTKVIESPGNIKHGKKTMFVSMVKYLAALFALTLFTYQIIAFALVPIWLIFIIVAWYYIKLWKYHGYSVPRLLIASGVVIIAAVLLRPFLLALIWRLGIISLMIAVLALLAYAVLSKIDTKYDLTEFRKKLRDGNKKK
jgi:hypothetical protein